MVIHVKLHNTDIQKIAINVRTKLYNKMPDDIKEYDSCKARRKELISRLIYHAFLLNGGICLFIIYNV
jgi:hypothetical protein